MYKDAIPFLTRVLTPLHAGVGQDMGSVDMPIQREASTGLPKIEASTYKGCLRATFEEKDANKLFGKENDNGSSNIGAIGISDLKLLFYPIKSPNDIFKLVTCPFLLNRYLEDKFIIEKIKVQNSIKKEVNEKKIVKRIYKGEYVSSNLDNNNEIKKITLDDYMFDISADNSDEDLKSILKSIIKDLKLIGIENDFVIINDEDFVMLEELNREIITRNRINQKTGIVEDGALFTEEYLPAESIMYGLVLYNSFKENTITFKDALTEIVKKEYFQVGGNSNLFKGLIQMKIIDKDSASKGGH